MERFPMHVRDDIDDVRRRIIDVIDKPIVDFTVEEICAKAHVSKQTFYSRFSSKFDIVNWYCARCEQAFLYEIGRTLSWEDGLGALFATYEDKCSFLHIASIRTLDDGGETKARHRDVLKETLTQRGICMTQEIAFLIEAYLELEVYLVGEWFRSNFALDAGSFTRLFIDCIPCKLYELLQVQSAGVDTTRGRSGAMFSKQYPEIA